MGQGKFSEGFSARGKVSINHCPDCTRRILFSQSHRDSRVDQGGMLIARQERHFNRSVDRAAATTTCEQYSPQTGDRDFGVETARMRLPTGRRASRRETNSERAACSQHVTDVGVVAPGSVGLCRRMKKTWGAMFRYSGVQVERSESKFATAGL